METFWVVIAYTEFLGLPLAMLILLAVAWHKAGEIA